MISYKVTAEEARKAVAIAMEDSAFVCVTPYPFNDFEVEVKDENSSVRRYLDEITGAATPTPTKHRAQVTLKAYFDECVEVEATEEEADEALYREAERLARRQYPGLEWHRCELEGF